MQNENYQTFKDEILPGQLTSALIYSAIHSHSFIAKCICQAFVMIKNVKYNENTGSLTVAMQENDPRINPIYSSDFYSIPFKKTIYLVKEWNVLSEYSTYLRGAKNQDVIDKLYRQTIKMCSLDELDLKRLVKEAVFARYGIKCDLEKIFIKHESIFIN